MERESLEHWAILSALERRDAQKAQEETRRQIRNLALELTEVLDIPKASVKALMAF